METKTAVIFIGMPKLLPAESRYTPCAVAWVNAQLCEILLARLGRDLPGADVHVGVTDYAAPFAKIASRCNPLRRRELVGKALRAAAMAIADTERLMAQPGGVPESLSICRNLAVDEIQEKGRITEYRLTLLDLSDSQRQLLVGRDWTTYRSNARICLTVESYNREKGWLSNRQII